MEGPVLEESVKVLFWLVCIVSALLGIGFFARHKKIQFAGGHGDIKVLATHALGIKEKIVVVEVAKQQLVLGVAPGNINILHALDDEHRLSATKDSTPKFGQVLKSTLKRETTDA